MNDFLAFLRELSHNRNFHWFAVGVHLCGLALFAYCYSRAPSGLWVFFMGWSGVYGASSTAFLMRKNKSAD